MTMAKKATSFMKEAEKGWIEVRKSKTLWTNGQILVMDGYSSEFGGLGCGKYSYDVSANLIKPVKASEFPKVRDVIPKRRGYHKAEPVTEFDMLKLLKRSYRSDLIVILKGKGVRAFLNYKYYQYLTEKFCDYTWKVKGAEEPILFYYGKTLVAVVMPVRI